MKRALITGITGQDGSYLAELLLEKKYEVHGLVRGVALEDPVHRLGRIQHILDRVVLHPSLLENSPGLLQVISDVRPDEVYHLAAQSFVSYSFEDEVNTLNANIRGVHSLLAAVQHVVPESRFYFAASSEIFGAAEEVPQNERTRFRPRSAYGISKMAGYELTRNYREGHGLHASSGILYNHESPRRGYEFVTRKITSHAARIKLKKTQKLRLGDLDAARDWGDAREYVQAIWLMTQKDAPDDYVIATGQLHTVREFLEIAFGHVGLDYRDHVEVDPRLKRPPDRVSLRGDASKAADKLGWRAQTPFKKIVTDMVDADLAYFSEASAKSVPWQG